MFRSKFSFRTLARKTVNYRKCSNVEEFKDCFICSIGIGESIQNGEVFKHACKKPSFRFYRGVKYRVCRECFDEGVLFFNKQVEQVAVKYNSRTDRDKSIIRDVKRLKGELDYDYMVFKYGITATRIRQVIKSYYDSLED